MFAILQKPQDNVNAEDLESLQNDIERRLVNVVTQKWKLERELDNFINVSPDSSSQPAAASVTSIDGSTATSRATLSSSQPATNILGGKLRNSLKLSQIDSELENVSDAFGSPLFLSTNNNHSNNNGTASGTNSNETDSVSSEGSLTSNLTGSTIITAHDFTSQYQSASSISTSHKRALKNSSSDRPSKRFRQNSSNSIQSTGSFPKRSLQSKHRTKIVPVSTQLRDSYLATISLLSRRLLTAFFSLMPLNSPNLETQSKNLDPIRSKLSKMKPLISCGPLLNNFVQPRPRNKLR